MGASSLAKPLNITIVTFLIVFVICLLLYRSSIPTRLVGIKKPLNIQSYSKSRELFHVLRSATMQDRTVILTILNETWASPGSVLDLFLESFRIGQGTQHLLNHIVVVALDNQAYQYCTSIHPHCFQLTTFSSKLSTRKGFTSLDHIMLNQKRNDLLLEVLELGYNIIFTEADAMWLRNPVGHFDPNKEITIPCDFSTESGTNKPDKGLFYLKSNECSIALLKYLHFERVTYPTYSDKSLCETTTRDIARKLAVETKYLDTAYFGGFCDPSKDMSEIYTMHSTCCDNIKSKVYDLRLVLDDWINFTTQISANASMGSSSFSWRAPKKCIS